MESKSERWPLLTFKEYEKDINPNPTYQRSEVWKTDQKQLLIDSVLRRIDIPKIYLRGTPGGKFEFEVIDGQQRMRALWEYLSSTFALSDEAEQIQIGDKVFDVSDLTYADLPSKVKLERIHKYTLDVVIVQEATEDEIADLFYRLNNGTPLKPAEVRNAIPGEMTKTIRTLATHKYFQSASFANRRYAYDQVAAQTMMLELSGGPTDVTDRLLSKMYADHQKKVVAATVSKVTAVYDTLAAAFPDKSRLLNRAETLNVYLLMSYLLSNHKLKKGFSQEFQKWYQKSEAKRLEGNEYKLFMVSAANSRRSIEERFKFVLLDFANTFPSLAIVKLDTKRIFDNDEKIKLFARDKSMCQKCKKEVGEFDWHADHILAWIRGGKTIMENGQVLCKRCNLQKKDKMW